MPSSKEPDPAEILKLLLHGTPIVSTARASMATFFKDVITSLDAETQKVISRKCNDRSIEKAIDELTVDLIDQMNTRLSRLLGK